VRSRPRHLVGVVVIVALWWIAFHRDEQVPLLAYVNLGFHEFGHFVTYAFGDMVTALMGSIAQVAVPVLLGAYFFFKRGDWMAASLCLAWAATSSLEVADYVADAPYEELQLIGGQHDWAFILGPDGYDALEKSASIADAIRDWALIGIAVAFALCLAGCSRDPYEEETEATSWATPDSSAWAASATSGSAPRSASSPQYTPPS
jgi:hypothetical protein